MGNYYKNKNNINNMKQKKIRLNDSLNGFISTSYSHLSSPSTSLTTTTSFSILEKENNNNIQIGNGFGFGNRPSSLTTSTLSSRIASSSSASSRFRFIRIRTGKEMFTKMYLKYPTNLNLDLDTLHSMDMDFNIISRHGKSINFDLIGSSFLLSNNNLPQGDPFSFFFPFPAIFPSLMTSIGENIFGEVAGEALPGLLSPSLFVVGVPIIGLVSLGLIVLNKSQKQGVEGALKKMEDQMKEDIMIPESSETEQSSSKVQEDKNTNISLSNENDKRQIDLDGKRSTLIKEYTEKEQQKSQQNQNDFRQNQKTEFLKDFENEKLKEDKLEKLEQERLVIVEKYSKIAAEYTRQKKEKENNLREALFEEFLALEKNKKKNIVLEEAQDKFDEELQKEATKKVLKEAIHNTQEKKENRTNVKKNSATSVTVTPTPTAATTSTTKRTTTTTTTTIKKSNTSSMPKTKAPTISTTQVISTPEQQEKRAKEIRQAIGKLNQAKATREKKNSISEIKVKENRTKIEKAVENLKKNKSFDVGTKFLDQKEEEEEKNNSSNISSKAKKTVDKKKSREELLQGLDDVMDALKEQVQKKNVNLENKNQAKRTKTKGKTAIPSPTSNNKKSNKPVKEDLNEKKGNSSPEITFSSSKKLSVPKKGQYSEASNIIVQQTVESLTIPKLKAFLSSNGGITLPSKAKKADYVQATVEYVEQTFSFEDAMKTLERL